jgi:hypothetical protein
MSEKKEFSRREILRYLAAGGLAATGTVRLADKVYKELREPTNFVKVDKRVLSGGDCDFPPAISRVSNKRASGLAKSINSPEKGGQGEVYRELVSHPYVGFEINGRVLMNVFNEGAKKPSLIHASSLSYDYDEQGKGFWDKEPSIVSAFIVAPGVYGPKFHGNWLFIHNHSLLPFGIYHGVYEDKQGNKFIGKKGAYKHGVEPIGILRYPIAPGTNDRLLLYGINDKNAGPNLEDMTSYRCTEADIMAASVADKIIVDKSDRDILYVQTCYPPEQFDFPGGRVVLEMTKD